MFSSIGWGEIFFVLIIGLIVIGPERLPGVIQDVRAAIYAARKAIDNAKKELELDSGLAEFEEFRKPLDTVTKYASMGPRRAITKALFDDEPFDVETSPDPRDRMESPQPPETYKPPHRDKGAGFSWEDVL
ncbi:Sec-independent protein translocase protein TatB [Corynebacterium mayonis]|uniref:Sec-independent protein translocase protein TatB n=1 Tax=Corynebacterium mayonis TaxID=3062461 RepID=UPI00313FF2BF